MRRYGTHQSTLIKQSRIRKGLTQTQVSTIFMPTNRNSQVLSNIERGVCGIPPRHIPTLCGILEVPVQEMLDAMVMDYRENLMGIVGGAV